MSEELNKEFDEMLNDVMGGVLDVNDHSPESQDSGDKSLEAKENGTPEADEVFEPYGEDDNDFADDSVSEKAGEEEKKDGAPEKSDSVPEEKEAPPDTEKIALQEKISNYEKRLHDTQKAMHEANEERAKLQKRLEALEKNSATEDDDNWFSEDTGTANDKTAALEGKIEELEKSQQQFQQNQAVQNWLSEAGNLAKEHDDYNALVFERLEPLLDEENGDPAMRAAYLRWQDKSPKGAYEFAKKVFSIEDRLKSPPAGSDINTNEARTAPDPSKGKAGLDRINSAEFSENPRHSRDMIEEVFG